MKVMNLFSRLNAAMAVAIRTVVLVPVSRWRLCVMNRGPLVFLCLSIVLVFALYTESGWAVSTGPSGILIPRTQPDGSVVKIRVIGDEFARKTLSEDGRPVVLDEVSGVWLYATVDAGTLKKTSLAVGKDDPSSLSISTEETPLQQHLDPRAVISGSGRGRVDLLSNIQGLVKKGSATTQEIAEIQRLVTLYNDRYGTRRPLLSLEDVLQNESVRGSAPELFAPSQPTTGTSLALCVLVAFSDDPASPAFSQMQIEQMFNSDTPVFSNSGSIKKYYTDQSNGQLSMTTIVTRYVRLSKTRNYYDSVAMDGGASEIIDEVIVSLAGTDPTLFTANAFSTYQDGGYNIISGFSMFYPGDPSNNGLWPHSWWYQGGAVKSVGNGMYIGNYQISSLLFGTTEPVIGVACHELGHMICGFSDYYDYGSATRYSCGDGVRSAGVGNHCLMASSANNSTPAPVNPYLKWKAGWATVSEMPTAGDVSIQASGTEYYRVLKSASAAEYFILENRLKSASVWNTYLPDEGLAVWHIDESVTTCNELQQMTNPQHYELSLEQADGLFDLENYRASTSGNWGDATDYYDGASGHDTFAPTSIPNSKWWDGSSSGLTLSSIGTAGATMALTVYIGGGGVEGVQAPVMNAEPAETPGTANTVSWSVVGAAAGISQTRTNEFVLTAGKEKTKESSQTGCTTHAGTISQNAATFGSTGTCTQVTTGLALQSSGEAPRTQAMLGVTQNLECKPETRSCFVSSRGPGEAPRELTSGITQTEYRIRVSLTNEVDIARARAEGLVVDGVGEACFIVESERYLRLTAAGLDVVLEGGVTTIRAAIRSDSSKSAPIDSATAQVQASDPLMLLDASNFAISSGTVDEPIPDLGWVWGSIQLLGGAPVGAKTTALQYRLRVHNDSAPSSFYCSDYQIYLSSDASGGGVPHLLVYNHLGGQTDGGYDDDSETDSDIYLNWRSTTHFNGEDPNQAWYVYVKDTVAGDSGYLQYIEFQVYWEAKPDLTPYKQGWWDDKIPIGTSQQGYDSSHSCTGPYYNDQILYFNWLSLNQGGADASGYQVHVEVAGTGGGSWDWSGLSTPASGSWNCLTTDQGVGPLSAGTHTFKVWVDHDGAVTESNEVNNYYVRTITVASRPQADLTPSKLASWDNKIPIGTTELSGDATHAYAGPYYDDQVLYFNWLSVNQGGGDASGYQVHVEVTGAGGGIGDWSDLSTPGGGNGLYLTTDQGVGPLSAGTHTFKVWVDHDAAVSESNEGNNYYERTITVSAAVTEYYAECDDNASFSSPANSGWTLNTQFTFRSLAHSTRYYYRVKARRGANLSAWSNVESSRQASPTYTVTFNAQGGTAASPLSTTVTYGSTYGTLATTTREGYSFSGWWTGVSGSGSQVDSETLVSISGAQTLYAKWVANSYTVTFDGQSGSTPSPSFKSVTHGSTYGTLASTTRTGYTFAGWWTGVGGSGTQVTAATLVTIADAQTLYAKWTANTYTVAFDAQGGSTPSPASKSVTYDSTYGALATTIRPGYIFAGWWTVAGGAGTEVTPATTVSITGLQALYAKWTAKSDLKVTSLTLEPAVPSRGCTFAATVVLSNQGALAASNFHVSVWADRATVTADATDEDLGLDVAVLGAGQSLTNVFSGLMAGDGSMLQMLRVFADSQMELDELDEANNQATNRYLSEAHADFVVTGITLTPPVPLAGRTFSASVTVQNRGGISSDGGSIYFYTNKPATVAVGVVGNGLATVGALGSGSNKTFTVSNLSSGSAGAKVFRAFVDAAGSVVEVYETNNQTTLDYTVKSLTNLTINGSAGLGEGVSSPYTCTAFYSDASSEDVTPCVTWSENSLYASIASNGVLSTSNTLTGNTTCTLTVSFSGNATNRTITLQNDTKPDFQVTSIRLIPGGTLPAGKTFTAYVTVTNQGAMSGDAGYLDIWTNSPAVVTNKVHGSKYVSIGTVTNGQSRTFTLTGLMAPTASGTFKFRASVDSQQTTVESDETNNQTTLDYAVLGVTNLSVTGSATVGESATTLYTCMALFSDGSSEDVTPYATWAENSAYATIAAGGLLLTTNTLTADSVATLTASYAGKTATKVVTIQNDLRPDFVVNLLSLSPGGTLPAGKTFTAYVTVRNQGVVPGGGGYLCVWTNQSTEVTNKTYGNKYVTIGTVTNGLNKVFTLTGLMASSTNGTYTFRACVDGQQGTAESDETNNQAILSYDVKSLTNLVIAGAATLGEDVTAPYTCTAYYNDGSNEDVSVYATWTENSSYATVSSTGSLRTTNTLPADSAFTLTATFAGRASTKAVTLQNDLKPDFEVIGISLSPGGTVPAGKTFTAYVTVTNNGAVSGDAGYLSVWTNSPVGPTNKAYGNKYVAAGAVGAGQAKTYAFSSLTAPWSNGVYELRTCVDSQQTTTESDEVNNQTSLVYTCKVLTNLVLTGSVTVGEGTGMQYTCTAYWSDGSNEDVTGWTIWSDNSAYVVLDASGYASTSNTLTADSSATITGAFGSKTVTRALTIQNDQRPDFQIGALTISPTSPVLNSVSFNAYVTVWNLGVVAGNGGYVDIWTNRPAEVTNTAHGQSYQLVGTLGAGSNRVFTFSGLKASSNSGVYTLRSSVDSQRSTVESVETNNQGTLEYQVRNVTNLVVSGLPWVNENSGGAYGCTAYYSDGDVQDVTTSATWSENSSYATVNSAGWLTTLSVSSDQACKITATYGGRSNNVTVTILNR